MKSKGLKLMINILLCDDQVEVQNKYTQYLKDIAKVLNYKICITIFSSADTLLLNSEDWMNQVDLMLLDIDLGNSNGIELGKTVRNMGYDGELLFLTVSPSFVFESFYVNPIHYIIKEDNDYDSFKNKMIHVFNKIYSDKSMKFSYKINNTYHYILTKHIISFEVKKRIIIMTFIDSSGRISSTEFYATLESIENSIDDCTFIKTHRAFLINPKHIISFNKAEILLCNNQKVPISRKYREDVNRSFIAFLES